MVVLAAAVGVLELGRGKPHFPASPSLPANLTMWVGVAVGWSQPEMELGVFAVRAPQVEKAEEFLAGEEARMLGCLVLEEDDLDLFVVAVTMAGVAGVAVATAEVVLVG